MDKYKEPPMSDAGRDHLLRSIYSSIQASSTQIFHQSEKRHAVRYGRNLIEATKNFLDEVGYMDDEVEVELIAAQKLSSKVVVGWEGREDEKVEAWEFTYWPVIYGENTPSRADLIALGKNGGVI